MGAVAREAGTVVSAVMFGAIAASGVLPFARARSSSVDRGVAAAARAAGEPARLRARSRDRRRLRADAPRCSARLPMALPAARADAASSVHRRSRRGSRATSRRPHGSIGLGHARLLEYQDAAYARLYLERLRACSKPNAQRPGRRARLRDRRARPRATSRCGWRSTTSSASPTSRCRARAPRARAARSEGRRTARCCASTTTSSPASPEFAALLPPRLATRSCAGTAPRGERPAPFALPLKLGTHSVTGMVALRLLAGLKRPAPPRQPLRRRAGDDRALARAASSVAHAATGRSATRLAECGRLIKGYGTTNERGKANLLHVLEHLAVAASFETATQRAAAIRAARTAALADDAGRALDQALQQHGAPPAPVREQPVFWVSKRPAAKAGS